METRQRELDCRRAEIYQPQEGDLVLLRRFAVDKDKGRKLETRWEGPYRIAKITKSGVSVRLEDLSTGVRKGRYSVDDVKVYFNWWRQKGILEWMEVGREEEFRRTEAIRERAG